MHVYRRRGALALAVILAAACSDNQTGLPSQFVANLSTDQESPAVTNAGSAAGTATCTVAPAVGARPISATSTFTCVVGFSGLTGAPLQMHIHNGAPGTSGPVQIWLCTSATIVGAPAGTATCGASGTSYTGVPIAAGAAKLTADSLYGLLLGISNGSANSGAYVNIHTTANPGGEIRGVLTHPIP